MSVARLWLVPAGETLFPPRAPFSFRVRVGSADDPERGNLPVPPMPLPHVHGPEVGP
jgi:hypothetical protein